MMEALRFILHHFFDRKDLVYNAPQRIPDLFLCDLESGILTKEQAYYTEFDTVVLVYQSHYLADNLEPVYAICEQLKEKNTRPIMAFVNNLRDKNTAD